MDATKEHFVSQFYLRRFSDDGLINVYDKSLRILRVQRSRCRLVNPPDVRKEPSLHRVAPQELSQDFSDLRAIHNWIRGGTGVPLSTAIWARSVSDRAGPLYCAN